MKKLMSVLLVLFLFLSPLGITGTLAAQPQYSGYPTFSIQSVVVDTSVTIQTKNLPPYDKFDVMMNYMGTKGKDGVKVGTLDSGKGGSLVFTYNIPESLKGQKQIAIRIQSSTGSGYFAYNWFNNKSSGSKPPTTNPGNTSSYPTFSIKAVVRNTTVTIVTNNLPEKDTFDVLMNYMGTRGVNGYKVATLNSGDGGTQTLTYDIPSQLAGQRQIAIRLQSTSGSGYYAYNWFYNNTYP